MDRPSAPLRVNSAGRVRGSLDGSSTCCASYQTRFPEASFLAKKTIDIEVRLTYFIYPLVGIGP